MAAEGSPQPRRAARRGDRRGGLRTGTGEPQQTGDRRAGGVDPAAGLRSDGGGRHPRGVPDRRATASRRRGGRRRDAEGAAGGTDRSGRVRLCVLPDPQSALRRGESNSVGVAGGSLEGVTLAVQVVAMGTAPDGLGKRLGRPSGKRATSTGPEDRECPRPAAQRTRPPAACGAVGTGCAGEEVVFSASAARASYSSASSAKIVCARSSVTCCANLRQRAACSRRNANPASTIGHQRHSIRPGANYTGRRLVGSLIQVKRMRGVTRGCAKPQRPGAGRPDRNHQAAGSRNDGARRRR